MRKPSPEVKEYLSALGRKGGKSRIAQMSATERKELARKGGKARQAKAKQKKRGLK
jgi:general stress protein YciG